MIYQVDKSEYEAKETDNKSEKSKSKVNKRKKRIMLKFQNYAMFIKYMGFFIP